jgi:hypothetical protein
MHYRAAALVLTLLAPLAAQGLTFDKQSPGTLGQTLSFGYAGANTPRTLLFLLSVSAGPTPLAVLGDPRSLAVGLETSYAWRTSAVGPAGTGTVSLAVPVVASLAGAYLHFQTLTFPGASSIIDQISIPVRVQFGFAEVPTALDATLITARALGATFVDANAADGHVEVILAGGGQGSFLGATGLASSEAYDVRSMTVRPGPTLGAARALSTAVTLTNGRVLFAGGVDAVGAVLRSAEVYDPATNTFTPTGQMTVGRGLHAATLLADGRVLVVGGTTSFADAVSAAAGTQRTAEVWNPATGMWTRVADAPRNLLGHALTTLQNGSVLLSGGFQVNIVLGLPIPMGTVTACSLYNAGTNTWSGTGAMRRDRLAHSLNTVLLADGRVLAAGGASSGLDPTTAAPIDGAEVFSAGTWTALANLPSARAGHSATRLSNGKVILAGGAGGTLSAPAAIAEVLEFDPATNGFRPLSPLGTTRSFHGAAVTADGLLVLLGGQGGPSNSTLASTEAIRP